LTCPDGYTASESNGCVDVDECADGLSDCDQMTEECINTQGSFICICAAGFVDVDGVCIDETQCPVCGTNEACVSDFNATSGYGCVCEWGYVATPSGCQLPCDAAQCGSNMFCRFDPATDESATCECLAGTYPDANIPDSCVEACTETVCGGGAECWLTSSYDDECRCLPGFEGDPMTECTDIDECSVLTDPCGSGSAVCENIAGSYNCNCDMGLVYSLGTQNCTAPSACASNPCNSDVSSCVETATGAVCQCHDGYASDGTDFGCRDVDECANVPCGANSRCVNTIGSFTCHCITGYVGNPYDGCTNVNECAAATSPCGDNTVCEDIDGSFDCHCVAGYQRDGLVGPCFDIPECAGDPCGDNSVCEELPGSYKCECLTGYEDASEAGDGLAPTCVDLNECLLGNPCDPLVECINLAGSFACDTCPPGYSGNSYKPGRCVISKAGHYVDPGNQEQLCPAGQFAPTGSMSCTPCPVGSFSNEAGSAECTLCPAGEFQDRAGSMVCQLCPAGTYTGAAGMPTCDICPQGTFAAGKGSISCTGCSAGTFSAAGAQACQECPPGSAAASFSSECQPCPAGTSNVLGQCLTCPAGTFSLEGSTACEICPSGTYSGSTGSTECVACPAGSAGAAAGQRDQCLPCPENTFSDAVVAGTECQPCAPGFESAAGATECTDVNECLVDNGGCDPLTDCTNTYGSRACSACPEFYQGSGAMGCLTNAETYLSLNDTAMMEAFTSSSVGAGDRKCRINTACPVGTCDCPMQVLYSKGDGGSWRGLEGGEGCVATEAAAIEELSRLIKADLCFQPASAVVSGPPGKPSSSSSGGIGALNDQAALIAAGVGAAVALLIVAGVYLVCRRRSSNSKAAMKQMEVELASDKPSRAGSQASGEDDIPDEFAQNYASSGMAAAIADGVQAAGRPALKQEAPQHEHYDQYPEQAAADAAYYNEHQAAGHVQQSSEQAAADAAHYNQDQAAGDGAHHNGHDEGAYDDPAYQEKAHQEYMRKGSAA